jgi:hypothetical protein
MVDTVNTQMQRQVGLTGRTHRGFQALDSIRSHVRHFKMQVREFVHLLWQALRPNGCS